VEDVVVVAVVDVDVAVSVFFVCSLADDDIVKTSTMIFFLFGWTDECGTIVKFLPFCCHRHHLLRTIIPFLLGRREI